jgi:hypothetical protein
MRISIRPRSVERSVTLIAVTVALGIALRFVRMGQPAFVMKYGGSALWAATIYWVITAVAGRMPIARAAVVSGAIATAVEFFKLYRSPGVDAFRRTLPGVLLLGRYFSWRDIVAYWIGIAVAATVDQRMRRHR